MVKDNRTQEQKMGQDGTCETVRVKADNEQGFTVINAHDFDASKHEEFVEPSASSKKGKRAAE